MVRIARALTEIMHKIPGHGDDLKTKNEVSFKAELCLKTDA